MKYLKLLFLLAFIVTLGFSFHGKSSALNRFDVRYGYRERYFDKYNMEVLSCWVWLHSSDIKNITEISVENSKGTLHRITKIKDYLCPTKGKEKLVFFQFAIKNKNDLNLKNKIRISLIDGKVLLFDHMPIERITGTVFIEQLEKGQKTLKHDRYSFKTSKIDKMHDYKFQIYGPDSYLKYSKNISNDSLVVNLHDLKPGKYLFSFIKCSRINRYNFISREYSIVIEE